jgi:hypothetical protein
MGPIPKSAWEAHALLGEYDDMRVGDAGTLVRRYDNTIDIVTRLGSPVVTFHPDGRMVIRDAPWPQDPDRMPIIAHVLPPEWTVPTDGRVGLIFRGVYEFGLYDTVQLPPDGSIEFGTSGYNGYKLSHDELVTEWHARSRYDD